MMIDSYKIYTRGIILNKDNNILLIKKRDDQRIGGGEWLLPGGTLEFGENVEHALIREIEEETNLNVSEIELLSHKKMIIGDTHWLGIYFICKVKDEKKLTNMEPEKHETIGFFGLNDIPKMKDYMMIELFSNFSKEYFDITITERKQHSMQKHLLKYVENKVHSLIKENIETIKYIQVIGNYDRSNIVSKEEKKDKPFNFKRPTALLDGDTIYISCFPGEDYIKHYANIIATYYQINNKEIPFISYRLPNKSFTYNTFYNNGLDKIPDTDIIIFGNIDKIGLLEEKEFIKTGDFYYKEGLINNKKVLLLGCEFSIWGNIGEDLINALSRRIQFNTFIYVGKLGILDKNIEPNTHLATGNSSYINGAFTTRDNIFHSIHEDNIIKANHITCYSIIEESIYNICEYKKHGKFIDPEIGNMAIGCKNNGKRFSYLHIISDNVIIPYEENLSNERKIEIIEKRRNLFHQIGQILSRTI